MYILDLTVERSLYKHCNMESTVVDRLYREFQDIVSSLSQADLSLRVTAEETFQKTLLLAASSHFEQKVQNHIIELTKKYPVPELLAEFVRNKAIKRQYHTYFQWDGRNANSFFGLFGEGFKSYMSSRVNEDDAFRQAVQSFLELGNDRNRLVHQDFGTFTLEKTSEEIFTRYNEACLFVNSIEACFDEYLKSTVQPEGA